MVNKPLESNKLAFQQYNPQGHIRGYFSVISMVLDAIGAVTPCTRLWQAMLAQHSTINAVVISSFHQKNISILTFLYDFQHVAEGANTEHSLEQQTSKNMREREIHKMNRESIN
jgi:hypothetical protein